MIVGVEPYSDFGFVVDYFATDLVVGEDVVVAEVLEGSTVEQEVFGVFFVVNKCLTIECGTNALAIVSIISVNSRASAKNASHEGWRLVMISSVIGSRWPPSGCLKGIERCRMRGTGSCLRLLENSRVCHWL